MTPSFRPVRRFGLALLLCAGVGWLALIACQRVAASKAEEELYFHHDHILGTSLDVWLNGLDIAGVEDVEKTLLAEIERLRRIFSLYDEDSELVRLNRTREPMSVSAEMIDVLRLYEIWQERSHGAFSGQLGQLVFVWKEAEKKQQEPDATTLKRIVDDLRRPGWRIDETAHTVTRLAKQPLNLNSIAKGYIIQSAANAVLKNRPETKGLLLNLGGDLFVWGKDGSGQPGWTVGVQDPTQPQENAEPIARFRVHNRAVATSGGYERYYTIQGKRHSHLFDPRTGQSADGILSATVIATDNATANALATTLCILTPAAGLKLVASTPGAECLIVARDGTRHASGGLGAFLVAKNASKEVEVAFQEPKGDDKGATWPAGFQVNMALTIPESYDSPRFRKPYLAIWVENADAKPVRTIAVWGKDSRWIKELPQWWKFAKNDTALVKAVTRPTRAPGKYNLVWDGKSDKDASLPQGDYTIHVEVHREHGKLVRQSGKIACREAPAQITLTKNAETGDTLIEYAKKKAP
jgi:thiamine biosynthesis lipoprotein